MLNLDTHILIHALHGSLTPREEKLLSSRSWGISAIVLWEIAKLSELGRIEFGLESSDMRRVLRQVQVWPLDIDVCRAIADLNF